jgi:hypothetical protein
MQNLNPSRSYQPASGAKSTLALRGHIFALDWGSFAA